MFVLILIAIALLEYVWLIEPNRLKITHKKIGEGPKLRVVQFTDTHFGRLYNPNNITRIRKLINSANPDIVLFTGDFFDNYDRDKHRLNYDFFKDELSKINGTKYAVRGNHDILHGSSNLIKDLFRDSGFTVLVNQAVYNEELNVNILGIDDLLFGKKDANVFTLKNNHYNIVLMHQPDFVELFRHDINGTAFSGHSHGGQVKLPILTRFALPHGGKKFVKGFYPKRDYSLKINSYVSSGIGNTGLKLRFFNVPEVAVIDFGTIE